MEDPGRGKEGIQGVGAKGHEGNARDIGSRHGDRDGVLANTNPSPAEGHQGDMLGGKPLGEYCRVVDSLSTVTPGSIGADLKKFARETPELLDLKEPHDLTPGLDE